MLDRSDSEVTPPTLPSPASSLWLSACVLFALAQVLWAGYQLGVGNQGIQIAFLQTLHDPARFTSDLMVGLTLSDYPSLFFASLAPALDRLSLPTLYLGLHLATAAAAMIAMTALARAMFPDRWPLTALTLLGLLLAGHHQGLAGESLYSSGFTHTWAVFPIGLAALAFFYHRRHLAAFALVGLLFNFHALEAAYLGFMMLVAALGSHRDPPIRRWLVILPVALLAASPTVWLFLREHKTFGDLWLQLTHIRSADHSFPSTWWQAGNGEVPRLAALLGLAALATAYPGPTDRQRKTYLMAGAVGLLFIAGYVFTELLPVSVVVRAQLFRSSRFLLVLALIQIAHGIAAACMLRRICPASTPGAFPETTPGTTPGTAPGSTTGSSSGAIPASAPASTGVTTTIPRWKFVLESIYALVCFAVLALPEWAGLLTPLLLVGTLVALITGRLSWHAALLACSAILIALWAWRSIHFIFPGLSPDFRWSALTGVRPPGLLAGGLILAGLALWGAMRLRTARWLRWALAGVGMGVAAQALVVVAPGLVRASSGDPDWIDAQRWAADNSPSAALFMVPIHPGGFRIHSGRAVVGEWRDGTQLYFSPDYAPLWWERMTALQPGLARDPHTGRTLVSRGRTFAGPEDQPIIDLARRFGAHYIVLPAAQERRMVRVYHNPTWAIYRPMLPRPEPAAAAMRQQDRFLRDTALPNIEKHRKSDATLRMVDPQGRPIVDLAYEVVQTGSRFSFGCSLPFFHRPEIDPRGDYKPPAVDPRELQRFLDVFNASMIPFSGKWMYLEPEQGQRRYDDLDAYVDWCRSHGIRVEFHFLSGYHPRWLRYMPVNEQAALFLRHATELVERYGDRIDAWQVVNEKILIDQSPPVFEAIRGLRPSAELGIADCARFFSPRVGADKDRDLLRGIEEVRWLKSRGVKVDYFGFHGHRPLGVWPDAQEVYRTLDAFAAEGVRLRVTELGVPLGKRIEGPVREAGETWTPELQAEFYERLYILLFSHPAVDSINLFGMGPDTWIRGAGLLDRDYQPKPAFDRLRRLITERWRTRLQGRLSLDGAIGFRGFHGDYELRVRLPGGDTVTAAFDLLPSNPPERSPTNTYRFVLDADKAQLRRE